MATDSFIHSFIQHSSAFYVPGPEHTARDTRMNKIQSLPTKSSLPSGTTTFLTAVTLISWYLLRPSNQFSKPGSQTSSPEVPTQLHLIQASTSQLSVDRISASDLAPGNSPPTNSRTCTSVSPPVPPLPFWRHPGEPRTRDNATNGTSSSRDESRPLLARSPSPLGRGRDYALYGLEPEGRCRLKTRRRLEPEEL